MQPTLTLQEEELARSLKAQGKSTQEIMGAIAKSRTATVTPAREVAEKQAGVFSRVAKDIPSDFIELGQNVIGSVQQSGRNLRETWQDPNANFLMKAAATAPQLGKSVLDVAGEAAIGYGKLLTTDEFEKAVSQKIGEVGQDISATETAQKLVAFRNNLTPEARFVLDKIIAPTAEVMFEGATAGAGTVGTRAAGEVVESAVDATAQAARRDFADVTEGVMRPTPEAPIVAPLPPEVKDTIVKGFDQGIKPNLASKQTPVQRARYEAQVAQAVESISNNVENLRLTDEATGELVSKLPENLKDFVDALEQTKQTIFRQYDDIASRAGDSGAQVDTVRIANSLDDIINSKSLKVSNPESIAYAESVRDRLLSTRNLSALDAQDVIQNYNNSLDAFYRNPTPEGLSRNAVDALVANQMRRALDEEIDALTGAQYQALKNEYAALKAVERDIMRAYNRDARRNAKGLIDFTDVFSGGQVVAGILSFNPAVVAQGLTQKAISGVIKMVNDPNRKVRQIFKEAARYRRPDTGMQMPTRRQLPPPREGAVRSEITSGAPIATAGQTARGRVEPGITERVREGAVQQPSQTGKLRQQASRFKSVESFVAAVRNNPAWAKKFEEAGVTPEQIAKMVIGGGSALGLVYLLDDEELSGMGFMVVGSILGGKGARNVFVKQMAKNADEADLLEMSQFVGAVKDGAYKTNKRGELQVVATKNFSQEEAQGALNDALRRADDFPVVSSATLKELADVFDDTLKEAESLGKSKGATPQTTALLEEARKYKSAEEFMRARGDVLYHGTNRNFEAFDINAQKQPGHAGGAFADGISFTPSKEYAKKYADRSTKRAGGEPIVKEVIVSLRNPFVIDSEAKLKEIARILNVEPKYNYNSSSPADGAVDLIIDGGGSKVLTARLKELGYDGVIARQEFGDEYVVFDPNTIKTRTQLEDIWKQANQ